MRYYPDRTFDDILEKGADQLREPEPAGGDILVYAKVRDPEPRIMLNSLLDNLPGERVNGSLYEVFASDWDPGLWDEEVDKMQALIDTTLDTLIFWKVVNGRLVRTCIAGRLA